MRIRPTIPDRIPLGDPADRSRRQPGVWGAGDHAARSAARPATARALRRGAGPHADSWHRANRRRGGTCFSSTLPTGAEDVRGVRRHRPSEAPRRASSSRRIRSFPRRAVCARLMDVHADLFDAVEYNAMFTSALNFNRRAVDGPSATVGRWLATATSIDSTSSGRPGRSWMRSRTRTRSARAIKAGRVRIDCRPLDWFAAIQTVAELLW